MPVEVWLTAATAAAFLVLALLAGRGRARHPLALQLGLMSVGLFAYNVSELLSLTDARRPWIHIGDAAAALTAIPTLELFLGFIGLSRRLRGVRWAVRAYFGALAIAGLAPLVNAESARLRDEGWWALSMVAALIPAFGSVAVLLLRHTRRSHGPERARSQLLAAALLLGVGSATSDLWAMTGAGLPRLSYVGLIASAALLAAVTLKARIVERPTARTTIVLGVVGLFGVMALQLVAVAARGSSVIFLLGAIVVVLLVVSAVRPLSAAATEERARERYLATIGRFSSQMAHDIRNPLAAIRGAAQFLKEERTQGRSMDGHEEFVDMIIERTQRVERLVRDYLRMGRLELDLAPLDVNALVTDAVGGLAVSGSQVAIDVRLAAPPPLLQADRDLLCFALENVLRNACEAMAQGGQLAVRTETSNDVPPRVSISVEDSGCGMDVRTRERALEGFFTTKEGGSGFGLAFVARVVEAHGGALRVESEEGKGTLVVMYLPGAAPSPQLP